MRRLGVKRLGVGFLIVVVGALVLAPMVVILWGSVRTVPPGVSGGLTLRNYGEALGSPTFGESVSNSVVFAIGATALSFGIGTYLAWLTERTDAPLRRLIYLLVLIPVAVPGVLTTVAWSLILHDRIGIAPLIDGTSMAGMIWTKGVDGISLPFLLAAVAFRAMDPTLEEASRVAGATSQQTLRRVTLPLMAPALLASALIVFVGTIDSFDVPAVLGLPAGVRVLSTEVFLAAKQRPVNANLAAAYAVITLVISIVALWCYFRATKLTERFATITSGGHRAGRRPLGRWRPVHAVGSMGLLAVIVVAPLLLMAYTSLIPFYTPPKGGVWRMLSLDNYRYVLFESPIAERAVVNNVIAGGLAALVVVGLALAVSIVVLRGRGRGRRVLDALAFAPIAIPGLVLGLALIWLYLEVPIPVYATLWIIGIAWITSFLPLGLRIVQPSLAQVSVELEEASRASGAGRARTLVHVVVPLILPGLLAAFVYVLSLTFKVVSLPILLGGPRTEVLPTLIFDLNDTGRQPELNALGVMIVLLLAVIAGGARLASRRFSS
jgi:iron(III) transport system permease protein